MKRTISFRHKRAELARRAARVRPLACQALEDRRLLASDWQNPALPVDVDNSGFCSFTDALALVTGLRENGVPFMIPPAPPGPSAPPPWYDVDGSELVTIGDLLLVVGDLRQGIGQPMPELQAALTNDTAPGGGTNNDRLTFDDALGGSINTGLAVGARVLVRVDGGPWLRLSLEFDGDFEFLTNLPKDGTADGEHTISLAAQNFGGTPFRADFTFALDTQTVATARLAAADDSGASNSDGVTNVDAPTIEVDAESGAMITLLVNGNEVGSATAASQVDFPLGPLTDGTHEITSLVEDAAGNTAEFAFVATVDSQPPNIVPIEPLEGVMLHRNSRLTGDVDGTGSPGEMLSYQFDTLMEHPVALAAPDFPGFDFDRPFNLTGVADGPHMLTVNATDLAGNAGAGMFNVMVEANAIPLTLLGTSPFDGEQEVGVTVHPQIFFSKPIDTASLSSANFFASVGGDVLPTTIVPAGEGLFAWLFFDDPMPAGMRINVAVDGATILAADDGSALDADGDGQPGGMFTFSFETNSLEPLPGTSLTGIAIDAGPDNLPRTADDAPLAGVEVFLVGLDSNKRTTGADGRFTFDAVPVGDVKVAVNGLTAPAPAGVYFPELVMDSRMLVGQVNTVMPGMEGVILPRIRSSILQMVDGDQATMLTPDEDGAPDLSPEDRARLTIEIPADSLVGHDGSTMSEAMIGISTVPQELVRDMLPPGLLKHTFDITVQAMGVANFANPAPLTFPNVFAAAPGEQLNFLSFDHNTGLLVIEGTATVSADGLMVTTDPGYGVTHPGWHGMTPQGGCGGSGGPPIPVPPSLSEVVNPPMVMALGMLIGRQPAGAFPTQEYNSPPQNPNVPPLPPIPGCQVPRHNPNVQQQPFLNVTIAVDGPLAEFAKPIAGGLPLESQSFTLSPGTNLNKKFGFTPKTYIEMFGANGITTINRDKLYGASVKITVIEQMADGTRTRNEKSWYQYRWVEAIDAEDIAEELRGNPFAGNIAAFHPVLTNDEIDTPDGFIRQKNVDYNVPGGVTTEFIDVADFEDFDLKGPISGRGAAVWEFDPDAALLHADNFDIQVDDPNRADLKVGNLVAKGRAVHRTEVNINRPGYIAELRRVLLSLRTVGGNVQYTFTGGRTRNAGANFLAEFNGFLPADRQVGPDGVLFTADDTFMGGDLNDFLDDKAEEMVTAVRADFDPVNNPVLDAISIVDSDDPADGDVTMVWEDSFQAANGSINTTGNGAPLFGFADFDADLANLVVLLETPGRRNGRGRVGGNFFSPAARQWALAHFLNQQSINDGSFSVGININWDSPTAVIPIPGFPPIMNPVTFAEYVANTVSHEVGHPFGLKDAYRNNGVAIGPGNFAGCAVAPATGMNCKPNDIMRAGGARDPDLTFAADNMRLLQAAMGIHANGDLPLTAALQLYQDVILLPQNTEGVRELELAPGANQPELGLVRGDRDFFFTTEDDLGQVEADGAGGEKIVAAYFIENVGLAPLTVNAIRLVDGNQGFALTDISGAVGMTIDAGSRLMFTLEFDPASAGQSIDTLVIESNAAVNDPLELELVALGLRSEPVARVEPADANNFGGLLVAGQSKQIPQMFSLSNDGAGVLEISSINLAAGADTFSLLGVPADLANNPVMLDFGETFTFGAAFDPNRLGLHHAAIEIATNDPDQPTIRVGAVGTGIDPRPYPHWGNDFVAIETPDLPASPVLRVTSDDEGSFEIFLSPQTMYHMVIFDPVTGLVSHSYGRTAPSGAATDLTASIVFSASLQPDGDGEGLPDDVEFAIGTAGSRADTDNDGVSDAAEIEQGLNPLDGVAYPTGLIGSVNARFTPADVLVEPAVDGSGRLLAFLPTFTGLTTVDVTNPTLPTILSDLPLVGVNQDVSLDSNLGLAAVASGAGGLHLIDVSDPAQPRRLLTSSLPATQVEVFAGVAYTAENRRLRSIDLLSGALIDTIELSDLAAISALVREGDFLYALTTGNRLHVIETSAGRLTERGMLQLTRNVAQRPFVGNGVFYIPNAEFVGGFLTVDVSDPDAPQLISDTDVMPPNIAPQRAIAVNGSGLALLAGSVNQQLVLDMMDVSNPANTNQFITRFNLPGFPSDLALASGLAFVIDVTGLRVVNYLPFDSGGEPPEVMISSPAADQDAGMPGLQVIEGSTVPIRVQATDDVQVRRVELLLNGEIVSSDASFPYDFAVTAPTIQTQEESFVVQVRAMDTGGNPRLSLPLIIGLIDDTAAPLVTFTNPPDGGVAVNRPPIFVSFNEAIDPALLDVAEVKLLHFGLDQQLGGGDDTELPIAALNLTGNGRLLSVAPESPIPVGSYRLTVDASIIADLSGNQLAQSIVLQFAYETPLANTPPAVFASTPAPGAQLNASPAAISFDVFESLDPAFIMPSEFRLERAGPDQQLGTPDDVTIAIASASLENGNTRVVVVPATTLPPDDYRFTALSRRIVDQSQNSLDGEFPGIFPSGDGVLGGDFVFDFAVLPAQVIQASPAPGSEGPPPLEIRLRFSQSVHFNMAAAEDFELRSSGPDQQFDTPDDVIASFTPATLSADGLELSLPVASVLPLGAYRFTAPADKLLDAAGNSLDGEFMTQLPSGNGQPGGNFVYTFEAVPPRIISTAPAPEAQVPSVDQITLEFDRSMDDASVSIGAFTVTGDGPDDQFGTPDDVNVAVDSLLFSGDRTQLMLNLASILGADRYRVLAVSSGLLDDNGVELDGDFSGMFPTGDGIPSGDFSYEFEVQNITSATVLQEVASRAMHFLRAVVDPVIGLPHNEARMSELDAGGPYAGDFFVPAQLGNFLAAAILSNQLRRGTNPFTAGYSDEELIDQLETTIGTLQTILSTPGSVYEDMTTGAKALYQVYDTATGMPRTGAFDRIVSLLDNVQLLAGLHATMGFLISDFVPSDQSLVGRATQLSGQINSLVAQFDTRLWLSGGMLHLGGTEDPTAGAVLDRITSEGRLAPVVALGRGELSPVEFTTIVQHMLFQSASGQSAGGIEVEKVPFFGTALEVFYPTAFLGVEASTQFFRNTLEPLADAWYEAAAGVGLPAAGATGISTGMGQFVVFGHSPSEGIAGQRDAAVSIPPAAGMLAGALGDMAALDNLLAAVTALQGDGLFHPDFGVPNYQDFGTGLVDESDPVFGTLEIAQMAVGLMNRMLAGGTLQFYLTRSPMFNTAMTAYFGQINAREAEFRPSGDGLEIARSAASSDSVWHLEDPGDLVEYDAHFAFAAPLNLILRYSNADAGSGDMITVLVNGMPVGAIATVNTGDFDIFTTAPPVPLGPLTGPVTIGLRLDATDGGGVDLDRFRIDFAQPGGEPESEAPEGESEDFASFIPTVVWDASDSVREAKTQQSAPVAAIHVVPRDLSKTVGATMAQDSRDQLDNTNPRRPLEDWSQAVDEYFAGFS